MLPANKIPRNKCGICDFQGDKQVEPLYIPFSFIPLQLPKAGFPYVRKLCCHPVVQCLIVPQFCVYSIYRRAFDQAESAARLCPLPGVLNGVSSSCSLLFVLTLSYAVALKRSNSS